MAAEIVHPAGEKLAFANRARELQAKYRLKDAIPNFGVVTEFARQIVEPYQIPETFWADDVNMGTLLGLSQKMVESTDPLYKRRMEGCVKRLIAPVAAGGTIDTEALWGKGPESGSLDDQASRDYIAAHLDDDATMQFLSRHADEISRCQEIWAAKGCQLDVQVYIVSDTVMEFKRNLRAGGYIRSPEEEDYKKGQATVEMVLLKGYSDNRDGMVRHELYHVEDFGRYVRRGHGGKILENLDELHTEYAAGNYKADHSKDPFEGENSSNYFNLKEFWDKLTFVADLDFNLLADRQGLLSTITHDFGFEGLAIFAMQSATGSGRSSMFESLFKEDDRVLMEMLIARSKIKLRRTPNIGNLAGQIDSLSQFATPKESEDAGNKYKSVYDLIPTAEGKTYSARIIDPDAWTRVDNAIAKEAVLTFADGLAAADLQERGEIRLDDRNYAEILEVLGHIPHHREQGDFNFKDYVDYQLELERKWHSGEEQDPIKHVAQSLYYDLVNDLDDVNLVFSLDNPQVRQLFLRAFFKELDTMAQFCIDYSDPQVREWFVQGFFKYNSNWEMRETSLDYLRTHFSDLKPIVNATQAKFDPRNAINMSL